MAGKLYYYDKASPYYRHLLGEVQATFNVNITLDGTKDSCKVQVLSFNKNQLEPYTICYLDTLNNWWIVSNDKTERHQNESGFFYVHNLQLLGAIELLNARDLTDCAFYQDRYTIREFVQRLGSLSNYEFGLGVMANDNINLDEKINYIKTYENYTLLSALKDFFNGYNCEVKLVFVGTTSIGGSYLSLYSKTGNVNGTILDIDDFDDVRETRKIDKNSYGTQVVTNADNVTASKMQVYPMWGGVRLMSDSYEIDLSNSYIKLPSNLNNIEWVKMYANTTIDIFQTNAPNIHFYLTTFYTFDLSRIDQIIDEIEDKINTSATYYQTSFENIKEDLIACMKEFGVATLKKGVGINANDSSYIANGLLIPEIHTNLTQQNLILVEKEVKDALLKPTDGIGYDKGSNKILIDFLGRTNDGWFTSDSKSFDCGYYDKDFEITSTDALQPLLTCRIRYSDLNWKNLLFSVKYEPMTDMKIKVDNDLVGNDIQIYNQNGKLTDGNAFSKLLNSYAKEITTDNVTRYMCYYKASDLPKVGQIVNDNGTKYVINSVSMTFYQNELSTLGTFPYFVDCEITMSKQVAVKSLMVNPNSNIRDYGIPQKHTVKRKQLFRDYCEFDFDSDTSSNDYYLKFDNALTLNKAGEMFELTKCGIKTTSANNDEWYYQLETTRYVLKKELVTMVDFQDNNIIGYDFQNRYSGFDITKVLSSNGFNKLTSTPIQYTDNDGAVKDITILWSSSEQYNDAIDNYINGYDSTKSQYKYVLTSRCFINSNIYDEIENGGSEFETELINYNKDPLEIPVFEHTFQMGDTIQVEVGSDIFTLHEELFEYYYSNLFAFEFVDKNKLNEFNALSYSTHNISYSGLGFTFSQNATIQPSGNALYISLYETYNSTQNPQHINKITTIPTNKDLAIYRYEYSYSLNKTIKSLMFIIHLSEDTPISPTNDIILYAHQWKLN